MPLLFIFSKKRVAYAITKSLYDELKQANSLVKLRARFFKNSGVDQKFYAAFQTEEPYITDIVLTEKEEMEAAAIAEKFALNRDEAEGIVLAKIMKCPLILTSKQLWLKNVAEKFGIETEIFKF